jgi:hypothetical protein
VSCNAANRRSFDAAFGPSRSSHKGNCKHHRGAAKKVFHWVELRFVLSIHRTCIRSGAFAARDVPCAVRKRVLRRPDRHSTTAERDLLSALQLGQANAGCCSRRTPGCCRARTTQRRVLDRHECTPVRFFALDYVTKPFKRKPHNTSFVIEIFVDGLSTKATRLGSCVRANTRNVTTNC